MLNFKFYIFFLFLWITFVLIRTVHFSGILVLFLFTLFELYSFVKESVLSATDYIERIYVENEDIIFEFTHNNESKSMAISKDDISCNIVTPFKSEPIPSRLLILKSKKEFISIYVSRIPKGIRYSDLEKIMFELNNIC